MTQIETRPDILELKMLRIKWEVYGVQTLFYVISCNCRISFILWTFYMFFLTKSESTLWLSVNPCILFFISYLWYFAWFILLYFHNMSICSLCVTCFFFPFLTQCSCVTICRYKRKRYGNWCSLILKQMFLVLRC
jgi:hypothetical protein